MIITDRVIYARKEGEASSGSVLEAGEKITLDQASVSFGYHAWIGKPIEFDIIMMIFNLLIVHIKTFCFIAIKRIRLGIG